MSHPTAALLRYADDAVAAVAAVANATGGQWVGPLYSGVCWRMHSMEALPLPGVGLANTLFGLLATLTFLIILWVVYRDARRARAAPPHEHGAGGGGGGGERSRTQSGSTGFLPPFASFPGGVGASDARRTGGPTVSFSSYIQFLRWSSLWALLWIGLNLFPQLTSGRDSASLVWHAIVSSVVYTASIFLELAVVVFLLHSGVGQQAFRRSAVVCGLVALVYGSLHLYFRIRWDIALARDNDDYPIAQLDFISSRETIAFLWITSLVIAGFFLAVSIHVQRKTSDRALQARRSGRTPAPGIAAAQPRRNSDTGAALGTRLRSNDQSALLLAGNPGDSALPTSAVAMSSGLGQSAPVRSASFSPLAPAVAAGESNGSNQPTGYGSGDGSGSSLGVGTSSRHEGFVRSPSPSASIGSGAPVGRPPPQRRSVVLYASFLFLYYILKCAGLSLLYLRHDAAICLIDGAILLYMLVYAFLLYHTLLHDSKYWFKVMAMGLLTQEEQKRVDESRLLTGPPAAAAAGSAQAHRYGEGGAVDAAGPSARRKLLVGRDASSDHSLSDDPTGASGRDRVSSLSSFVPSRATGNSGSSSGHLRSASVLLRDYIIPASQLSLLRVLEIPESVSTSTRSGRDSKRAGGGAAGSATSGRGSPGLSRSGSGSGVGLTKWSLAGAVSSRLRVVTTASGWSDRSCTLWLARWKGYGVGVKQFTLPSITADFFTRDFQSFMAQVPMGLWVGSTALAHDNLALCLGVSVDPPCVSLVFEYGAMGLLYDILYPKATAATGTAATTAAATAAAAAAAASSFPSNGLGDLPASPVYHSLGSFGFDSLPTSPGHTRLVRAPSLTSPPPPPPSSLLPATPGGGTGDAVSVGIFPSGMPPSSPGPGHSRSLSIGSGSGGGGVSGGLVPGPHLIGLLCPYRLSLQIASAMAQLQRWPAYDAHPLHLSPAAVMLDEALNAKLADFGDLAATAGGGTTGYRHGDRSSRSRKRAAHLSQPAWHSPEVLAGAPPTRASAVFSFATLLWCLLTWQYPCVLVPREERHDDPAAAAATPPGRGIGRAGGSGLRVPSPSRSHSPSSVSMSMSASASASASYRAMNMTPPVPSILKSTRGVSVTVSPAHSGAVLRPTPQVASERVGLLSTPLLLASSSASNSASSALGQTIRSPHPLLPSPLVTLASSSSSPFSGDGVGGATVPPSPDLTPPSSPLLAPSELADNDADGPASVDPYLDDHDPEVGGFAAPAVVLDVVRLRDLKSAQRYVMIENRRPPLPRGLPAAVARLIELCWDENPEDRPSFDIIVDHLEQQCGEMAALHLPLALPMPTHTHQGDAVHLYFQQQTAATASDHTSGWH